MTNIILFSLSILFISITIVKLLFRFKLKRKYLYFSLIFFISISSIYIFKSNLLNFYYFENLEKNISEGNEINPNEVIIFLENKLNKNPMDADSWLVLARTCLITGHIQKSELYYSKGLKYFPNNEDLLLESAVLKKSNKQYEKSLDLINNLIEINPLNFSAKMLLIEIMLVQKKFKDAQILFNELGDIEKMDKKWLKKMKGLGLLNF